MLGADSSLNYRVQKSYWIAILLTSCSSASKLPSVSESELIWVQRPDGTITCEARQAEKLEDVARSLREENVPIFDSKHSHDGRVRTQMCGIETGWLNTYRIPAASLEKARERGFDEVKIPQVPMKSVQIR